MMIAMLIAVIIIVIVMNDINHQYCVVRKGSLSGVSIFCSYTHGSIVLLGLPKYVLPKPLCCYMLQGSKP